MPPVELFSVTNCRSCVFLPPAWLASPDLSIIGGAGEEFLLDKGRTRVPRPHVYVGEKGMGDRQAN